MHGNLGQHHYVPALPFRSLTQKGTVSSETLFFFFPSQLIGRESSPNEIRIKGREESLFVYCRLGALLPITSCVTVAQ